MRRFRDTTIRVRVTIIAMSVTGLVAVSVYIPLLLGLRIQVIRHQQDVLTTAARQVAAVVRAGGVPGRIIAAHGLVQIVDQRGTAVAANNAMAGRPALPARWPRRDGGLATQRLCREGHCLTVVATRVGTGPGSMGIIAADGAPGLVPRPVPALAFGLGLAFFVCFAGWGTWRSAGRTLRPVEHIRRELDEITATDLNRRVTAPPQHDEIRRLAESVNATLDRLEAAVVRQRRFVSDVSHELRSPITGLRAELELALINGETGGATAEEQWVALRRALEKTLADAERLQDIVSDLLLLAGRDAGIPSETVLADVGEVAGQEVRRRSRRVPITVDAVPGVVAPVSRLDLGRVLTNLLDNAARHAETAVTVTVRREGGMAVTEVIDDGPGVPADERERIFERFTRLPAARERDPGGTGLGLSIARDIATAYGGTLTVAGSDVGARFLLSLPLAEP